MVHRLGKHHTAGAKIMVEHTPILFFTDDIKINPHTTSADLGHVIGQPITARKFSELVGQPVSLGQTPSGELYLAYGRYPNISFVHGPEVTQDAQAA
jgi:hypothetical protein